MFNSVINSNNKSGNKRSQQMTEKKIKSYKYYNHSAKIMKYINSAN